MRRIVTALLALLASSAAHAETLRIGISQFPPAIGNPYTGVGLPAGDLWSMIYDGLTRLDADGTLSPALALSWRNPEPLRWVFTLRPGVKFQNGVAFKAEAVVATVDALKSPAASSFIVAAETRGITAVKALDELTVEIVTATPDAVLPERMNLIAILEPEALRQRGFDGYGLRPVGTGPYLVLDSGKGVTTLAAFPDSWRKIGNIDRLSFHAVPNAAGRIQALMSKDLDFIEGVNPDDIESLRGTGFTVAVSPLSQILSIAFPNGADGPLKDARVRRALNMAVNREAIAAQIFAGTVIAAAQGATAGTNGYNPDLAAFPYDPEGARRLLKDAGYGDGFTLTVTMLDGASAGTDLAFQQVAQDLARVGVRAEVRTMPLAEFTRRYAGNDWRSGEAFSMLWNNVPFNDTARPLETFSCLKPKAFFCDVPTADLVAASARELDRTKRAALLRDIMARMHDLAPALWLTNVSVISAMTPGVTNFALRPGGTAFDKMLMEPVTSR